MLSKMVVRVSYKEKAMYNNTTDDKTKSYGKHSRTYWFLVYLVVGAVAYGIIYLLFIRGGGIY